MYGEIFAHFLIYLEALAHIWLFNCSTLNFLIYEDIFLISVRYTLLLAFRLCFQEYLIFLWLNGIWHCCGFINRPLWEVHRVLSWVGGGGKEWWTNTSARSGILRIGPVLAPRTWLSVWARQTDRQTDRQIHKDIAQEREVENMRKMTSQIVSNSTFFSTWKLQLSSPKMQKQTGMICPETFYSLIYNFFKTHRSYVFVYGGAVLWQSRVRTLAL